MTDNITKDYRRCQEAIVGDEFIDMAINKKVEYLSAISEFTLSESGITEPVLLENDKFYLQYIDTLIELREEAILNDFGIAIKQMEK